MMRDFLAKQPSDTCGFSISGEIPPQRNKVQFRCKSKIFILHSSIIFVMVAQIATGCDSSKAVN